MGLKREAALFAVGGVFGFVVDAGIVQALVGGFGADPYLARVLSFMAAATVTWGWNRQVTFAHRRSHRTHREWLRWMGVMSVGALINYGIYALLVAVSDTVRQGPWIGVAAGSAASALVNFCAARGVVFTGRKNNPQVTDSKG